MEPMGSLWLIKGLVFSHPLRGLGSAAGIPHEVESCKFCRLKVSRELYGLGVTPCVHVGLQGV